MVIDISRNPLKILSKQLPTTSSTHLLFTQSVKTIIPHNKAPCHCVDILKPTKIYLSGLNFLLLSQRHFKIRFSRFFFSSKEY